MNGKFELGQVVMTRLVSELCAEEDCYDDLLDLLGRHWHGDWGSVPEEDANLNNEALTFGNRILSAYILAGHKVWIITESDRSVTTVLFPSEW